MPRVPRPGEGPPTIEELLRLRPTMLRAARRVGLSAVEAEDVADEAVFVAWLSRDNFTGFPGKREVSLRAWVRAIGRNLATDRLMAMAAEQHAIEGHRHLHDPFDPGPAPRVHARLMLASVQRLPWKLRAVVLAVIDADSIEGAALVLALPFGTVATRWKAARKKLRRRAG